MVERSNFPPHQGPRRVRRDEGTLVLPPFRLTDLPPGGYVGAFMGIAALRMSTPTGVVAAFLHDLNPEDLQTLLQAQRIQAAAQLGDGYAKRPFWWEGA